MRLALALLLAACGTPAPAGIDAIDPTGDATAQDSRCSGDATLTCTSHELMLASRRVTYEVPLGTPPTNGWPVVVFYQGSLVPGARAFSASQGAAYGQYELTRTVKALLDGGYAVIAPNAQGDGSLYWQTNVPPCASSWGGCEDDVLVRALLAAITGSMFGPLDSARLYAMGISSGGFMTSRMAVSYPGTFRALAIASASYATCSNTCTVPALPADHPPTLFVHGGADPIVPVATMQDYRNALVAAGRVTDAVVVQDGGHAWLAEAVAAIPAWFDNH